MHDSQKIEFYNRKILVVGLGISGLNAARWLSKQGAVVTVSEERPETELNTTICKDVQKLGIALETGRHQKETFLKSEMIVLSPGVPHHMEPIRAAKNAGIPVTGELELSSRLIDTPMIAVTGTNGKSTVTALLGSLLKNANLKVFVGGNIGTPLMAYVDRGEKADYVVVEVSSFQLDTIETFCPFISILLNISPDHLDRYRSYEDYAQSKLRIFSNQRAGAYLILNDDDEILSSVNPPSGVSVIRFGVKRKEGRHAYVQNNDIKASLTGRGHIHFSLKPFKLPGKHNLENLLAVTLAGLILGIEPTVIQQTMGDFKGLPNRLEHVAEFSGVEFYNDSKATNVDAAVKAITSFDKPVILIAGGRHKGADYARLVKAARGGVRKAIFLGESRELLARSFEGTVPFLMAKDMDEAVSIAFSQADKGDAVLLAPACSSFDMFSDYAHRGVVFRSAVERLSHGQE